MVMTADAPASHYRLIQKLTIEERPERPRRRLSIDGEVVPYYTSGPVEVRPYGSVESGMSIVLVPFVVESVERRPYIDVTDQDK